ncbi:hypothetical protein DO71_6088 [Burkholderia pseudomallei]|nr:hypothetical protein DO71_6088 [Burkholderia pseudomallei]
MSRVRPSLGFVPRGVRHVICDAPATRGDACTVRRARPRGAVRESAASARVGK